MFAVEAPGAWSDSYGRPVIAHDRLLLAAGWHQGTDSVEATALVGVEASSGRERFRLRVPLDRPGRTECQVGVPALLPDGRILVAVYQWDTSLTVHVLDPQGNELRVDDIGGERLSELDLYGGDLGIKLRLYDTAVFPDAYIVSWAYRSRRFHLQCRDAATGSTRWEAEERALAHKDDLVLCETDPRQGALVARSPLDGTQHWQLPDHSMSNLSVIGILGHAVVLTDRTPRVDDLPRRDAAIIERIEGLPPGADVDALEREFPFAGDDLVAHDLADGRELWRHRLFGRVMSMGHVSDLLCVVTENIHGMRLELVSASGEVRAVAPLSDPKTAVVAVESDGILLATDAILSRVRPTDLTTMWTLPLPISPLADRMPVAADVSRIYMRVGARLWALSRVHDA